MNALLILCIIVVSLLFAWGFYEIIAWPTRDYRTCTIHDITVKPGRVCPECMEESYQRRHTMEKIKWDFPPMILRFLKGVKQVLHLWTWLLTGYPRWPK